MTFHRVDPVRLYESKEVCKVQAAFVEATVAANTSVIAAVSGKRHRVMGWIAQCDTATVGTFQLKSASAGTMLMAPLAAPPVTNGDTHTLPITDSGYMETNTGEGLFVDVVTGAVNLTVFYITYIP